jgi:hypothetical protein
VVLITPTASWSRVLLPRAPPHHPPPPPPALGDEIAEGGREAFQEGAYDCWEIGVPCEVGIVAGEEDGRGVVGGKRVAVTHVEVEHQTNNHWRGLFLESIWVSAVRAIGASVGEGEAIKVEEDACAALFTAARSQEAMHQLHEEVQGEREGEREGWTRLECRRWFDSESGSRGVCYRVFDAEGVAGMKQGRGEEEQGGVGMWRHGAGVIGFEEGRAWVTNSAMGVNGMMGNQLFQLAALIGVTARARVAGGEGLAGGEGGDGRGQLQVVIPDIEWSGREQERLRVLELLEVDVPMLPLGVIQARVQEVHEEHTFHYDETIQDVGCDDLGQVSRPLPLRVQRVGRLWRVKLGAAVFGLGAWR